MYQLRTDNNHPDRYEIKKKSFIKCFQLNNKLLSRSSVHQQNKLVINSLESRDVIWRYGTWSGNGSSPARRQANNQTYDDLLSTIPLLTNPR